MAMTYIHIMYVIMWMYALYFFANSRHWKGIFFQCVNNTSSAVSECEWQEEKNEMTTADTILCAVLVIRALHIMSR